jgi:hypothetical protein
MPPLGFRKRGTLSLNLRAQAIHVLLLRIYALPQARCGVDVLRTIPGLGSRLPACL